MKERTWSNIRRGRWDPAAATLDRLDVALADLPAKKPPQIVKAFHRHVMKELCRHLRAPMRQVLAEDLTVQRPRNANWLQAARINRMAIYIIAVELELENAELARALGCTRQNVKQARDDVFDWMDEDLKVARAIAAVSTHVTGRAE